MTRKEKKKYKQNLYNKIKIVKNQIANDKLELAIESLSNFLREDKIFDEVIVQRARLSELKRKIRLNIIHWEEQNIEKNRIRISLLEMIDEIKNDEIPFEQNDNEAINTENYKFPITNRKYQFNKRGKYVSNYILNFSKLLFNLKEDYLTKEKNQRMQLALELEKMGNKLGEIAEIYSKEGIPEKECEDFGESLERLKKLTNHKINPVAYRKILGMAFFYYGSDSIYNMELKDAISFDLKMGGNNPRKVVRSEFILKLEKASGYFIGTSDSIKYE